MFLDLRALPLTSGDGRGQKRFDRTVDMRRRDEVGAASRMAQKVSEVVGTSKVGFAKAAENAVAVAARTVRNIKPFRVGTRGSVKNGKSKNITLPSTSRGLRRVWADPGLAGSVAPSIGRCTHVRSPLGTAL